MGFTLGGLFFALLFVGVPLGIAIGFASFAGLYFFGDVPLEIGAQRMIAGIRTFPLLAIPLFILAGNLMSASGITKRIIDFAYAVVGSVRGGLSAVNILASMVFGGISGSALADTSAIGRLMIPSMVDRGYPASYSVAVTSVSATLAPLIPPSISLIVFGVMAQVSIVQLFFVGLLVGVIYALVLMVTAYGIAVKRGQVAEERLPLRAVLVALRRAFWALLMPVIVLGGIRFGVFTPTEGGAIAVVYALFVGIVVHRDLHVRDLPKALVDSGVFVGVVMLIIAMASIFSWALLIGQVPQNLTSMVFELTDSVLVILLLFNLFMLFIGMVVETNAALIIFTPILLPVMTSAGVDPIHFGIIFVFNLGLGLFTPPVGMCLLLGAKIGQLEMQDTLRDVVPFFIVGFFMLLAVTYLPLALGWF